MACRTRKFQSFIKRFDRFNPVDKRQFSERGYIASKPFYSRSGRLLNRHWWRS